MFRIEPKMPATSYKTYQLLQPRSSHFRPATCAEVECQNQACGWRTTVDESHELGQEQAFYIRKQSGRKFTEERNEAGLTVFTFEAGQNCFAQHKAPLERDPLMYVRGGDWRGNPRNEVRQHSRLDDWVDDFANHQDQLATRLEQG